ncbi:unnamed protein product [Echinostoma caproni]|uniref:E3 ubiquitin-protein ligase n=1 Tax=Echinostoma caproni TaxID=27848 RepID=A0A183B540_9TREM|nr:unnamed protein product [Echinostoma caproni]
MRQRNPRQHFFNGGLADRRISNLDHLLRCSISAHVTHAVVSRGCPSSCDGSGTSGQDDSHRFCWPQHRDSPTDWWWYAYCAPHLPMKTTVPLEPNPCKLETASDVNSLVQTIVRVAVTDDARYLWRLLMPRLNNRSSSADSARNPDSSQTPMEWWDPKRASLPGFLEPQVFLRKTPVSLIWEVDITYLFISLLHLRPGLEEARIAQCQCERLADVLDELKSTETGAGSLGAALLACDEGRPRIPVGDAHETHLVRLCYCAILVQALLSWNPGSFTDADNASTLSALGFSTDCMPCSSMPQSWSNPQLLEVCNRLRKLVGLPVQTFPSTDVLSAVYSLSTYVRIHCLPFLRIAAFVIHLITQVEVPHDLRQVPDGETFDVNVEYDLLLTYLGLPRGPSDLLSVLSTHPNSLDASRSPESIRSLLDEQDVSSLSESLWLARLIIGWCLSGLSCSSRELYQSLCAHWQSQTASPNMPSHDAVLYPEPISRLPHLIPLPHDYTNLLSLIVDFKCNVGGNAHSDPSICLLCGHVACFMCYGCRQFEPDVPVPAPDSIVYSMPAHSRRCHSGYSLILRIYSCRVFLLSDQARRFTEVTAPYRDVFGETDPDLK